MSHKPENVTQAFFLCHITDEQVTQTFQGSHITKLDFTTLL